MNEKKEQAREFYFQTEKSQQEIADILNVHRKTVNLWIKHGKWKEMKLAALHAPGIILHNLYTYIRMIDDKIYSRPEESRCPTPEDVNMICKLIRAANQVDDQQIGAHIQAYEEFMKFLNKEDRPLMLKVLPHIDGYVKGYLERERAHVDEKVKQNIRDVRDVLKRQEAEETLETQSMPDAGSAASADYPREHSFGTMPVKEKNSPRTPGYNDPDPFATEAARYTTNPSPMKRTSAHEPGFAERVTAMCEEDNRTLRVGDVTMCNNQVTMCNNDSLPRPVGGVTMEPAADGHTKPAPAKHDAQNDNASMLQNTAEKIYSENVTSGSVHAGEKIKKEKAIRDQQMEKLMNKDIYNKYKGLLNYKSSNIYDRTDFNGRFVNKMWLQYNLGQMELPEDKRLLLTEEEYLHQYSVNATQDYTRRAG